MPAYSVLVGPNEPEYCAITKPPEDMPDEIEPRSGDRIGKLYPGTVDVHMSKLVNPRGLKIADVILNAIGYFLVSERMKGLLLEHAQGEIEYLPIRLINHKGRVEKAACFFANVIGKQDCADRARSEGVTSKLDDEFISCDKLVLDPAKIPRDRNIFRTTLYPTHIVVRDDLRAKIEGAKMTVRFLEVF